MAIKVVDLGGTEGWTEKEVVKAIDLNDTFNAMVDKLQTLTAFWLNDFLYDVYEDFDSYSVGDFTSNTKWDVSGTGSCSIENSQVAGGTTNELYIDTYQNNMTVTSLLIPSNRHIFARLNWSYFIGATNGSITQTFSIGNDTDGFSDVRHYYISSYRKEANSEANVLIIAKGDNKYDAYWGGKKVLSDLELLNGCQLKFYVAHATSTGYSRWYIDDVRVSKGSV